MVNFIQKLIKKRNKLRADPIPAGDNSIKDNKSKKSGKLLNGLRAKFRSGLRIDLENLLLKEKKF
ncbi:MAG: hypothetical protein CM1200mP13_16220 [Candidatus Pelagibacterales bacterium]|nr:MAG: hypothetical protein CM1200mP13_16220 [Pelagibacterales bacterium]